MIVDAWSMAVVLWQLVKYYSQLSKKSYHIQTFMQHQNSACVLTTYLKERDC